MTQDWTGKKAIILINKNGKKLTFNAHDIHISDAGVISFTDKMGARYGYPTYFIDEIREVL